MSNKTTNTNKTASKANSNLVVMDANNLQIPQIMAKLEEKLSTLDKITESNYVTSGKLEGSLNIQTVTKVEDVIRIASVVIAKEAAYQNAVAELGVSTSPVFTIAGYKKEDWLKDCKLKIALIEQGDTKAKLKEFKDKFSAFITEEQRKDMLLQEFLKYTGESLAELA